MLLATVIRTFHGSVNASKVVVILRQSGRAAVTTLCLSAAQGTVANCTGSLWKPGSLSNVFNPLKNEEEGGGGGRVVRATTCIITGGGGTETLYFFKTEIQLLHKKPVRTSHRIHSLPIIMTNQLIFFRK